MIHDGRLITNFTGVKKLRVRGLGGKFNIINLTDPTVMTNFFATVNHNKMGVCPITLQNTKFKSTYLIRCVFCTENNYSAAPVVIGCPRRRAEDQ